MPYSANPYFAPLYDPGQIGVPLPALAHAMVSPLLLGLWRQLERALNADGLDYEKRRRLPLNESQRMALREGLRAAEGFCAAGGLDPRRLCLGLFDEIDGQRVALGSSAGGMHYLLLSRALLATAPAPARDFIIAHELAHILNGDTDNAAHRADKARLRSPTADDQTAARRPLYARLQRVELAADIRAMHLFPTPADGLAALTGAMLYLQETMHDGRGRNRASARFSRHPSHIARIRHAERHIATGTGAAVERHRVPRRMQVYAAAPLISEPERLARHFAFDRNGAAICRFVAQVAERAGPRARFVRLLVDRDGWTYGSTAGMTQVLFENAGLYPSYELNILRLAPCQLDGRHRDAVRMTIAHELGHYLNGDNNNPRMRTATRHLREFEILKANGGMSDEAWREEWLDKVTQADKLSQRKEYAADRRGLQLFASPAEARPAMEAFMDTLPYPPDMVGHRLTTHPSPRARRRVARDFLAAWGDGPA